MGAEYISELVEGAHPKTDSKCLAVKTPKDGALDTCICPQGLVTAVPFLRAELW